MTDLSALPVPAEFARHARQTSREDVEQQAIEVDLAWWKRALESRGLPGRLEGTTSQDDSGREVAGRAKLTRKDVFERAGRAASDPKEALNLLWHALAWGAGTSARNMNRRLDSIKAQPEEIAAALAGAASLAQTDVGAAYAKLRPGGRNLVRYLGPAFFSKYLYFAGGGDPNHPCLILDARVASALQQRGWDSLRTGGAWPATTYRRYTDLLERWAIEASATDRSVAADELEFWLFRVGAGTSEEAPNRADIRVHYQPLTAHAELIRTCWQRDDRLRLWSEAGDAR